MEDEKRLWEVYTARCAQDIAENTARFAGGRWMDKSYLDILDTASGHKTEAPEIDAEKEIDDFLDRVAGGERHG